MPKAVTVRYFAVLREKRGTDQETVTTGADTARALYAELAERHGFTLSPDIVRVSINDQFRNWDTPVSERDCVAFIPPVAGG